jgi:CRISPR/Cas system CSM-associated protein Csm3 (group 7 of RAMP superfamily)
MFEKYKQDRNKDTVPTFDVYRLSCAACRLFGSHGFVGRFAASDAYPKANSVPLVEVRDGVAIDRFTGGAAQGAKYDLEVLTRGEFETTLEIRNFERWQLGLVGLVLRDMEEGLVRIGFGKSRGLGRIKAAVTNFEITYYNRAVSTLAGLDALCSAEDRRAYGFFPELQGSALPLPQATTSGLRHSHNVTGVWKDVLTPGVEDLLSYLSAVNWPQALERYMTA